MCWLTLFRAFVCCCDAYVPSYILVYRTDFISFSRRLVFSLYFFIVSHTRYTVYIGIKHIHTTKNGPKSSTRVQCEFVYSVGCVRTFRNNIDCVCVLVLPFPFSPIGIIFEFHFLQSQWFFFSIHTFFLFFFSNNWSTKTCNKFSKRIKIGLTKTYIW